MPCTEGVFWKVTNGLLNLKSNFFQKREALYLTSLWQKKREMVTEMNSHFDFGISDHMIILAMYESKTLHTYVSLFVLVGFCTCVYKP